MNPYQFAAWVSQLNVTYTPLTNISGNSADTTQPDASIYGDGTAALVNGTVYVNHNYLLPMFLHLLLVTVASSC